MIALHAALLARQGAAPGADDLRPPRGPRRDDEAPPGDRPPPDRGDARRPAPRPGHRGRHGRRRVLHAHAGRPVARRDPRGRPVPLPERPHPRARDARRTRRRTAPSAASARRRPSSPPRRQLNRIADALGISPLELRRRNVYTIGDTTPTGQVLRDERGRRGGPRARGRGRRVRADAGAIGAAASRSRRFRHDPGSPLRTDATASPRGRARARLARRRASPARARSSSRRSPSLELTADGRIDVLVASTEIGQGTKTIFPQIVADALGVPIEDVEIAPQDTAYVPDSRADGRVAHGDGRRRAADPGGRAGSRRAGRGGAPAGRSPRPTATTPAEHGRPAASTSTSSRTRASASTTTTYRGDAYPAFGWAACVATVDVDLDTGEVQVRDVVAVDDVGKVIHPVLAEGQVEGGTLQAVGYAHDRGDQAARRPLPQRPARDLHHPDLARRAADHDRSSSRRRSTRPARREGRRRAADGRRGAGRGRGDRGRDRGMDRGPAGQPGADPRGARRCRVGGPAPARRLGTGAAMTR